MESLDNIKTIISQQTVHKADYICLNRPGDNVSRPIARVKVQTRPKQGMVSILFTTVIVSHRVTS